MTILGDMMTESRREGTAPDDIQFESVLEAPPAKVWRALTVPAYVAAWLMPPTADEQAGTGRMSGKDADEPELVDCRVLDSRAPNLLRYAWSEATRGHILDSVVTFELAPHGDGSTLLRVTHGSFILRPIAANLNQPTMLLAA